MIFIRIMEKNTASKKTKLIIRGRLFLKKDIKKIEQIIKKNYSKGRTFISVEVCKQLQWLQPNGWLKDRACRDALRILENKGLIKLPASHIRSSERKPITKNSFEIDSTPITNLSFKNLRFESVKGSKNEKLWNYLVNEHHYLGFNVFVGRSLKYLIYSDERIIAALGWCDPAWSLTIRDELLKKCGKSIDEIRHAGVNNGRFLILPWVKVPNLASFLLSKFNRLLVSDWSKYYSVKPLYLETFVDPSKFSGTCYKAANWILIGKSKGYRKIGMGHQNTQSPKLIYIFCLDKEIQKTINSHLPTKADD